MTVEVLHCSQLRISRYEYGQVASTEPDVDIYTYNVCTRTVGEHWLAFDSSPSISLKVKKVIHEYKKMLAARGKLHALVHVMLKAFYAQQS
jgi:hypothetical protein